MLTESTQHDISSLITGLRSQIKARAAGLWQVEGEILRQLAFVAEPSMSDEAANGFGQATLLVPLNRTALGIVRAVIDRSRFVSIAADLDPTEGSGYWLRRFGALRSVAVPISSNLGRVIGVVSVALNSLEPPDDEIEAVLRSEVSAKLLSLLSFWQQPGSANGSIGL